MIGTLIKSDKHYYNFGGKWLTEMLGSHISKLNKIKHRNIFYIGKRYENLMIV